MNRSKSRYAIANAVAIYMSIRKPLPKPSFSFKSKKLYKRCNRVTAE